MVFKKKDEKKLYPEKNKKVKDTPKPTKKSKKK